jgi:hypothetical protein
LGIIILAIFMISLPLKALGVGLALLMFLLVLYHFLSKSKGEDGPVVKLFG